MKFKMCDVNTLNPRLGEYRFSALTAQASLSQRRCRACACACEHACESDGVTGLPVSFV